MSEPAAPKPVRPAWRTLVRVVMLVVGMLVLTLEIGSRICDAIVDARRSDPEQLKRMRARDHEPDLVERLSFGFLEYGSMLRAEQLGNLRSQPHPYLGYSLIPSFESKPGAEQQVRHNSLGFRGKETTWKKPPGTYRIVTTGGSSVYGQSESCDAAVWSQRLEDYLNQSGGGRKFEVVNTGVPGYSSFEMLVNLEFRALDLEPDLVIVYEAINDMRCALYWKGGERQRDNTHWRTVWMADRPSALEGFLAHSRTYLVWRRYSTDYVQQRSDLAYFGVTNYTLEPKADPYARRPPGSPIPEMGFETYRRNLDNIITLVKARGAQILIVTQALPRWHLDDAKESAADQVQSFARIQDIQRELANTREIPLFECAELVEKAAEKQLLDERDRVRAENPKLSEAQAEHEARQRVGKLRKAGLFWNEVHPNDAGSDLIARLISEYLVGTLLAPPK